MHELQNFSRHIAHDLRRPMGRLRHKLEEAVEADDLGLARARADAAIDETDDLLNTFDALLEICNVEVGPVRVDQAVPLDDVARKAVELYAEVAEEKDVSLTFEGAPVSVRGEPSLIAQLAINFIDNAIKFSPNGGAVRVSVEPAATGAVLRVRDQGPGIPAALRDAATQRFARLESARGVEGHGLGLALARAIAERHGAPLTMADAHPGLDISVAFKPA
jgi:signal transduction histidine kinase